MTAQPTDAPLPATDAEIRIGRFRPLPASPMRRLKRHFAHAMLRAAMQLFHWLVPAARPTQRIHRPAPDRGLDILLTGTFHAAGWIKAHLRPLAASPACATLYIVSTYPIPRMSKVVPIYPPPWLRHLCGDVAARLLTFVAVAVSRRPHVIGGFHLLVNGLLASALARIVRARSLYFCVGGPLELLDGGIWAENRLFGLLETPDPRIEGQLIRGVGTFDAVITMGRSAARFFRQHAVRTCFHIVPGGIDADEFHPACAPPVTDLILVGRLAEIKRIDIFLQAVALASRTLPDLSATIVGDGELGESLVQMARQLGIDSRVRFAGRQSNVSDWLRQARVFVLTSDSEGLALSLMEAMMCGLVPIVSHVGDLGDLVIDGANGCLVQRRCVEAFAARIVDLLRDPAQLQSLSVAARQGTLRYDLAPITNQWTKILTEWAAA